MNHEISQWVDRPVEELTAYLDQTGIEHRPGRGQWQALQARLPEGWCVVHLSSKKHGLGIPICLAKEIKNFL